MNATADIWPSALAAPGCLRYDAAFLSLQGAIMTREQLEARVTELEIQVAWQDDALSSLSDTVARLQQTLDLQQAQLRLLYQRLPEKSSDDAVPFSPVDEVPPHY